MSLSYRYRPPGATHTPFRFSYRLLNVALLACFLSLSDAFVPTTPYPVDFGRKASSRSAGVKTADSISRLSPLRAQDAAKVEDRIDDNKQITSGAARDVDQGAVLSDANAAFAYSTAEERRAASEPVGDEPQGLKVVLTGKPCSGKGTQAPMMGRKYRMVHIATGNLLRAEIQAETELGLIAKEQMEKGELLPDELIIALVKKRVSADDCRRNGWILDGFPRTVRQAKLMQKAGIEPDAVIELDRPDELVEEWCLGRYHDAAT
ncbi:hypothetical protein VYU27_010118, partial [Nannochloropsis oceanica]